MRYVLISITSLALATFLNGCTEDFEDAPFRCKINGEDFIATGEFVNATLSGSNNFRVTGTNLEDVNIFSNKPSGEMKIDFVADSVGTYPLNLQNTWRWSNNGEDSYRANGTDPGTLIITSIDYNAKRITGTFELTAYADNSNNTKSITEGFFDATWN